jgi:hypothetical protein
MFHLITHSATLLIGVIIGAYFYRSLLRTNPKLLQAMVDGVTTVNEAVRKDIAAIIHKNTPQPPASILVTPTNVPPAV